MRVILKVRRGSVGWGHLLHRCHYLRSTRQGRLQIIRIRLKEGPVVVPRGEEQGFDIDAIIEAEIILASSLRHRRGLKDILVC